MIGRMLILEIKFIKIFLPKYNNGWLYHINLIKICNKNILKQHKLLKLRDLMFRLFKLIFQYLELLLHKLWFNKIGKT